MPLLAAVPASSLGPELAVPAVALAALALAAFVLARRRPRPSRLVRILETASLGPKRSLIVARVGEETLILGASEAGISLLGTRAALEPPAAAPAPEKPAGGGLLGKLRLQKAPVPAFEPLLRESLEDRELRAKVAAGFRGTVP